MEGDAEFISHSGLVARSPQGHAATSMPIKGNEDIWVEIQAHTFRNWVNDMLKDTGYQVQDLATDLCDGAALVSLVEVLQKRRLRKNARPVNQHQMLENATNALNAIVEDGIKLVNIGMPQTPPKSFTFHALKFQPKSSDRFLHNLKRCNFHSQPNDFLDFK
jgi:filamin